MRSKLLATVACIAVLGATGVQAQPGVIKYSTRGWWSVGYEIIEPTGSGLCQAVTVYDGTVFYMMAALEPSGDRNWAIHLINKNWKWVKKDSNYTFTFAGPNKSYDVTLKGDTGGSLWAFVSKDLMNAIAVDSKGKVLTIHQKGKVLGRYALNDSAAAIRDIVHCTNEHKPRETEASKAPPKGGDDRGKQESGYGTGFFVTTDKVFTNHHIIKGCGTLHIKLPPYRAERAYVYGEDELNDLAILTVNMTMHSNATFRFGPKLGEPVAMFGFPLTEILSPDGNFTLGHVASTTGIGGDSRYFQISAGIQPGSSGSPVLDQAGNVIGVATLTLSTTKAAEIMGGSLPQNLNFAISTATVVNFLKLKGVDTISASYEKNLGPEELAAMAKKFTVQVLCGSPAVSESENAHAFAAPTKGQKHRFSEPARAVGD